ncbi:DNA N-glycosylase and apurinic/apyrimidinic (AP) lyase [Cadophora gregata]|uniref:DNA N-glycosylase and apurinic/apyrimidinic (AP) lyase n=1 Tax=Cadophora gregata TaxID=51156 RepID=UPI0026DC51FC|nr:DNA N-glycosylase and apurinic/apyrimidinic (AP) lyase [Cadophora gregata]KAK0107360.1 DNA N-glycosylase and apurinic/apyrimidinic (AP) lyase [Cadophora gregata]KAK0117038.1 DNA N-glycosylase and apurinic/apyrimidinic (AP) lyase [Cadophora gregata f. sp. sojae]
MRTSKISQETSKLLNATSVSPRRSTRNSISRFAHSLNGNGHVKDEDFEEPLDIEDVIPSRKRKRPTPRTPTKLSPSKIRVKTEIEETIAFSPAKERKVRKPARKFKNEETGDIEIHPPNDWAEVYAVVKEMRTSGAAQHAAVDTMGCERLAQETVSPKVKRFHTLIALMLSSQTKDTTNFQAMNRLYTELPPYKEGAPGGLNLENILAVDPKLLNELIWAVGFHNNKTKYIKATADILRDQYDGDIPDTIEGLMALPGVGPKMGYLCLSVAWGKHEGIGVDVHVHRITNLWGWHKTKGPEESRLALQAWLPKEFWHEINWVLVGLGQTVCLPVGRKCGECELGLRGLCKAAERGKVTIGRKLKQESIKDELKTEVVKAELTEGEVVVNADPEKDVKILNRVDGETA